MLLIVEGHAYNRKFLLSEDWVSNWLLLASKDMHMGIIAGPLVKSFGESQGVSGVVIIKESHIAIHTWPEISWLEAHVSSCRDFNAHEAVGLLSRIADIPDPMPIIFGGGINRETNEVTPLHLIEWSPR